MTHKPVSVLWDSGRGLEQPECTLRRETQVGLNPWSIAPMGDWLTLTLDDLHNFDSNHTIVLSCWMPMESPHKPWFADPGPSRNVFQDLEGASHLQRAPSKEMCSFCGCTCCDTHLVVRDSLQESVPFFHHVKALRIKYRSLGLVTGAFTY